MGTGAGMWLYTVHIWGLKALIPALSCELSSSNSAPSSQTPAAACEPRAGLGVCVHMKCVYLTISLVYYFLLAPHCRKHFTGVMGTRILNCIIVIFFSLAFPWI